MALNLKNLQSSKPTVISMTQQKSSDPPANDLTCKGAMRQLQPKSRPETEKNQRGHGPVTDMDGEDHVVLNWVVADW